MYKRCKLKLKLFIHVSTYISPFSTFIFNIGSHFEVQPHKTRFQNQTKILSNNFLFVLHAKYCKFINEHMYIHIYSKANEHTHAENGRNRNVYALENPDVTIRNETYETFANSRLD